MEIFECPNCGIPGCSTDDVFCTNCGYMLQNYCSNPECNSHSIGNKPLADNMCFCPVCGHKSVYMTKGYIKPIV